MFIRTYARKSKKKYIDFKKLEVNFSLKLLYSCSVNKFTISYILT